MAKQCIMAGTLNGGGYEKMLEQDRRVYSAEGASPTVRTKTGGNKETVIMEDIESGYEMYNGRKTLRGGYERMFEQSQRVYSPDGASPTIHTMQDEMTATKIVEKKYRIRKLTPRECGRLMGVADEDSDKIFSRQLDTLKYHLCGDSIVTACLMAIFGEMCDVDYNKKIDELTEAISSERSDIGGGWYINER